MLVFQIWNAIIIMYRKYLLSIDHMQKLLYYQVDTPDGHHSLHAPQFFVTQSDKGLKGSFFLPGSKVECYILFFA